MNNRDDFLGVSDYQNQNSGFGYSQAQEAEPLHRYTAKTFAWMFAGLAVTFLVAISGPFYYQFLFSVPAIPFVLLFAELGVVLFLSARIEKLSVGAARTLFFAYSALNGIVFSTYFLIYDMSSLLIAFASTGLFFGIMAVVGYTTHADFSKVRNLLMGGLVFLAVFWIASLFINLSQFEMIACTIGLFVFLVFTAYDTQKIKAYHQVYSGQPDMAAKASIFSALQLYLDFINLFIYLLRILGRRK